MKCVLENPKSWNQFEAFEKNWNKCKTRKYKWDIKSKYKDGEEKFHILIGIFMIINNLVIH